MAGTPLKQTPRVVSQGTKSNPVPQPKPSFQGPVLPHYRPGGNRSRPIHRLG